jgi:acetylornithine/N-succinyldiaminopimelate aminotransferase
VPGFVRARVNDLDSVRKVISPKTAAIMLEPIQGEAGVIPFTADFLRTLRQLTRDHGLLLILDEIQTGVGRTGRMFCFEEANIKPDVLTLGKGIGGGVPLAALLAREEFCLFEIGDQGGTFNGNPLMTSVGLAVVEAIAQPEFLAAVRDNGSYLEDRLHKVKLDFGLREVRGRGLLLALELDRDCGPQIVEAALKRRLLLNSPRPTTLRFMPALNVTRDEIDRMIEILRESLKSS